MGGLYPSAKTNRSQSSSSDNTFSFSMTTTHLRYLLNGILGCSTFEKMPLLRILCLPKLHQLGRQYVPKLLLTNFRNEN